MMEGCSVCVCDENELGFPRAWIESKEPDKNLNSESLNSMKDKEDSDFGWVVSNSKIEFEADNSLGKIERETKKKPR